MVGLSEIVVRIAAYGFHASSTFRPAPTPAPAPVDKVDFRTGAELPTCPSSCPEPSWDFCAGPAYEAVELFAASAVDFAYGSQVYVAVLLFGALSFASGG